MTTKPEPIIRPNGTAYQPRKLRAFALNVDDDPEEVLVLGTHDVDIAYPVAKREATQLFREDAVLVSPQKVWKTQKLSHFVEGAPWYEYADDPERGAAGVLFTVEYPDTTSTALAMEEGSAHDDHA